MKPIQALCLLLAVGLAACSEPAESGAFDSDQEGHSEDWVTPSTPAFPGATGYGSGSKGGRGGRVFQVTTLADSGSGSLRECIEAISPRVCVFRVSGVIRFTDTPPRIRHPFITIAGQTAPGSGITLAHGGGEVGRTPLVIKDAHDVIVRHLRVRNDRIGDQRGAEDSITIENSSHVIIDHVSASWARDELVNGHGNNNFITVSNSIFSWGIPRHDKCALLASDPHAPQNFSFLGNLCAHNGDRNPDINFPPGSCAEIIGNLFYNAQSEFAEIWESNGGTPATIIGNNFIAGPDTSANAIGISRHRTESTGPARVFLADNVFDGEFLRAATGIAEVEISEPECVPTITPVSAQQAYELVLTGAGAFPRDSLDRQVIAEVRARQGGIMRTPGAIPAFPLTRADIDSDDDGMPDDWESRTGSNPELADAWGDEDGDGLANLDEYLEYRHQLLMGATTQAGNSS